jgi:CIC family chloride channel protein
MKLRRKGILFKEGREMNILRSLSVKDFLSSDYQKFLNTEHVGAVVDSAIGGKHHSFQIVDAENNYVGCFTLNQLKKLVLQKDILDSLVIAEDLAMSGIHLDSDADLETAMRIFGREDVAEIPVLQGKQFRGVVKRKDVIEAYNHEIIKREAALGLVQKLKFTQPNKTFDLGAGYKIMETDAPPLFWNKSLKELDLKAIYRIDVLLIKRKYPPQTITIPSAHEVIKKDDVLIIAGLDENIAQVFKTQES